MADARSDSLAEPTLPERMIRVPLQVTVTSDASTSAAIESASATAVSSQAGCGPSKCSGCSPLNVPSLKTMTRSFGSLPQGMREGAVLFATNHGERCLRIDHVENIPGLVE